MNLRALFLLPSLPLALVLSGCHSHPFTATAAQARVEQRAVEATEREQMEQVPPPVKGRFMAVRTDGAWQNPSITVQPGMLQLRVLLADANPSKLGVGSMLRPERARQQELNISLDKLGDAITSIPVSSWPYGRVVALEEARKLPAKAVPQVRRNMEAAIGELNDLGIVVYDVKDGLVR